MIGTILLCFAFVFFCFAAAGWESFGMVRLVPLGFAFAVLATILAGVRLPF